MSAWVIISEAFKRYHKKHKLLILPQKKTQVLCKLIFYPTLKIVSPYVINKILNLVAVAANHLKFYIIQVY